MVLKVYVGDGDIPNVSLSGGASVLATWRDTFGYAYLVLGTNGNPMGRLDPGTYEMTPSFGGQGMASYVDLTGATYNVLAFDAGASDAEIKLEMYGTQTVRVKLPFVPTVVASSNPSLVIKDWSYADGFLTMSVRGTDLTGQLGKIAIRA